MNTQLIKVEMVGLLPTLFSMCASCCTTDTVGACGIDLMADQMRDYSREVIANNQHAAELYTRLLQDYHGMVIPLAVSATSIRGLWLSLRHQLPADLSIVVNGRTVVTGNADYAELKQIIERELRFNGSRVPLR